MSSGRGGASITTRHLLTRNRVITSSSSSSPPSAQSSLVAGLHLHKSARFVLEWGCEEVFRWLATNNFGQYQVHAATSLCCYMQKLNKHTTQHVLLLFLVFAIGQCAGRMSFHIGHLWNKHRPEGEENKGKYNTYIYIHIYICVKSDSLLCLLPAQFHICLFHTY